MTHQIPRLILLDDSGLAKINPEFIRFNEIKNWSVERQISVFWKLVREHVFKEHPEMSEEKIDKSMQAFNTAYGLVKYKFQDIERNTGGRYFDHLVRVMQYLVINSKTPTIKKTIIALCHDIIEDTDVDFNTLKSIFGSYIALAVLIISKKPIKFFIEDKKDIEKFIDIKETGILNSKGLISDEFLQKRTYFSSSVTEEEKKALELFNDLENKLKEKRSEEYFSHMLSHSNIFINKIGDNTPCLNQFYDNALLLTLNVNLNIRLSKEEIKEVCLDALEVKFWDRIDNLRTTEIYENFTYDNYKKAQRKIVETEKYFYKIALEFDNLIGTNFYNLIFSEVEKLKNFILFKSKVLVKDDVGEIIAK